MGKKILFSPIGGTDPMSQDNCKDGSFIHICRVFKPDHVVMYMSKEMLDYQEQDNRYIYCLNKLSEKIGQSISYDQIRRNDLIAVHDYNYFYEDFAKILMNLRAGMGEDDELLCNISSGTPAMKSGLMVLVTMGEIPCKAIQVSTPNKSINEHRHKGYDVETLWELNEDNNDDFENRCEIVNCPSLSRIRNEEIIKKLIRNYDYSAAFGITEMMPKEYTEGYFDVIKMAALRLGLNTSEAMKISKECNLDCFPVKDSGKLKYYEYALSLDVKRKRGELGDYIRGITPLVLELFRIILKDRYKIDVYEYCSVQNVGKDKKSGSNRIYKWDEKKLKDTKVLEMLNKRYPGGFRCDFLKSDHLCHLIQQQDDIIPETSSDIGKLREIEFDIRNAAAHEMIRIDEDFIKTNTSSKSDSKEIFSLIKKCMVFAGVSKSDDAWDTYEKMNDMIIQRI